MNRRWSVRRTWKVVDRCQEVRNCPGNAWYATTGQGRPWQRRPGEIWTVLLSRLVLTHLEKTYQHTIDTDNLNLDKYSSDVLHTRSQPRETKYRMWQAVPSSNDMTTCLYLATHWHYQRQRSAPATLYFSMALVASRLPFWPWI